MKQLAKSIGSLVFKKLAWVAASSLGLSGIAVILVIFIILMAVVGATAGSDNSSPDTTIGGQYSCSPTGEVNQGMWSSTFASAGVLAGHEDEIMAIAEEKGIDPVLFASITLSETSRGTSNAIKSYNNPGGLMNPATGKLFRYSTLYEGLQSMGKTLYNRIRVDGLTTIEKLGNVYAPLGAKNDPNNLNSHWVPNVTTIAAELGGLTMNCEATAITGDTEASGVDVVDVGKVWIGKSKYVFGGGRSESDVSKGRFDCSSFVHWAFKQVGVNLGPLGSTSTETLKNLGTAIPASKMQPGDIIFFDIASYKKDGHVGIYMGGGKFIGCQGSTGVAVVDMNSGWWKGKFNGRVKRIM